MGVKLTKTVSKRKNKKQQNKKQKNKDNEKILPKEPESQNTQIEGYFNKFLPESKVKIICGYKNGVVDGNCTHFLENGNISVSCFYKEGELDGKYNEYYENGTPHILCSYVQGKLDGEYFEYYENGSLYIFCIYKNGNFGGVYNQYHKNGQLFIKCFYNDGLLNDEYREYYESGQLKIACHYIDESITSVDELNDNKNRNHKLEQDDIVVWTLGTDNNKIPLYVKLNVPRDALRITPYCDPDFSIPLSRISDAQIIEISDKFGKEYETCKIINKIYNKGDHIKTETFDADLNTPRDRNNFNVVKFKDCCDFLLYLQNF